MENPKSMNTNEARIRHRISHSEIAYRVFYPKKSDGSLDFFSSLPDDFTMNIRGKILTNKRFRAGKVYLQEATVTVLNEGDVVSIYRNGDMVIVE